MRFTTMRLCGGEALMAISADVLDLDMQNVVDILGEQGHTVKQMDDMMVVADWNGMETTVYPQGKIMFFPLKDRSLCIKYATEMIESFTKN